MLQVEDSTRLDEFLAELRDANESHCDMLREHLESARSYLIGAMPAECLLSLRLANETLDCVSNEDLRHRAAELINSLRATKM
jgi:hypothetical protein